MLSSVYKIERCEIDQGKTSKQFLHVFSDHTHEPHHYFKSTSDQHCFVLRNFAWCLLSSIFWFSAVLTISSYISSKLFQQTKKSNKNFLC